MWYLPFCVWLSISLSMIISRPTHVALSQLKDTIILSFVVQSLSRVWLFATPWTARQQASLSFTVSRSVLNIMSTESVMTSNHLILCHPSLPFSSCLQCFPASGSFLISWLFTSGGQNIGASASALVLPLTIQGWFPLGFSFHLVQSSVYIFLSYWHLLVSAYALK